MLRLPIDDRTYLKLLEEQDAEPLFNLTDSCRTYLREWLPWVDSTKAVEDTISFIESSKKKFASKNGMDAGIWYNGQLAGIIGLHFIDWTNKKTSIGYWLGEPFQGRGLMTKACIAMIHHIFNDLQLNRVEIRCAVLNSKSRAIPERLGFSKEGTIREAEWLYDHFVDHIVYSMLAREWKTQEKDPFKQSII
ncbi:GNAT family protein [Bacillus sp. FSL W8-0102]|uniref:GNAT family N-acetyltransferase n=1 Tax=unclassified Bacillus (in: firmicutes) TaxID=185979 RepID=UPI0030F7AF6C